MQPLVGVYGEGLWGPGFVPEDRLRPYAIACFCGLEDRQGRTLRDGRMFLRWLSNADVWTFQHFRGAQNQTQR